jgi:hypothetical protein
LFGNSIYSRANVLILKNKLFPRPFVAAPPAKGVRSLCDFENLETNLFFFIFLRILFPVVSPN